MAKYSVYSRDINCFRTDRITDWVSFSLVLRFNGVGTGQITLNSSSTNAKYIYPGAGIIVKRDNVTIFSGRMETEITRTSLSIQVGLVEDTVILETPARPTPSQSTGPFPDEYYVITGVASTIMRQLVDANLGPGAPAPWGNGNLVLDTDPVLGASLTLRANLNRVIDILTEMSVSAMSGGLGFRVVQDDSTPGQLNFSIYQPQDRTETVKFGTALSTAADYTDVWTAPVANYFYVMLGDGFGSNRTILEGGDSESIAELGRAIALVEDLRGTASPSEGGQRLAELLAGAISSRRKTIEPLAVPSLQYKDDWDLGDLVEVVVDGDSFIDLIREIEIEFTLDGGAIVKPMIAQAGATNDDQMAHYIASVQDRLSNVERNWTVPDNSIIRDMLTPVLQPIIGEVKWLATSTVPTGYLVCHGQSLLRSAYPLLYAAIGTAWGAADGFHFTLPNLADKFAIGAGSSYALAATGGAATINISHSHSHSHGGGTLVWTHTHTGQAHTHPGSHKHGLPLHRHVVDLDHDHGSFTSGKETNFGADALGRTAGATTGNGHQHNVDVPALGTTNVNSDNGVKTSGGASFNETDTDSDQGGFAASYSGSASGPTVGGTPWAGGTDADATAGGSSALNSLPPYVGLWPVIYTGQ